jgi:predicted ATP-dependent endonuclease of OLD family
MYISKLRIKNYKCFLDSQDIILGKGINIIVGPNNVGKTALLEVLSFNFQNVPHISELGKNQNQTSSVEFTLSMNKSELKNIIERINSHIEIPIPEDILRNHQQGHAIEHSLLIGHFENWLSLEEQVHIKMKFENGKVQKNNRFIFDLYNPPQSQKSKGWVLTVYWQESGGFTASIGARVSKVGQPESSDSGREDLNNYIFNILRSKLYYASATRLTKDRNKLATNPVLQEDGANLAQMLALMQINLDRTEFNLFNEIAKYLFPQIKQVSVKILDNNEFELQLWTITDDIKLERCALPISKCGTGFATTLPLITFMVTQDEKFLLIDEPQAFLHPGAMRKLIEKLNLFPQHQCFIGTHSPTVISTARSPIIVQLTQKTGQTTGNSLTKNEISILREILENVGAKLSDVFGADYILWVEGPTEEVCFPIVLESIGRKSLQNIQIIPLVNTGDFEVRLSKEQKEKYTKMILSAYEKLSNGYTLLPPTIAFILDSEGKDEEKKKELKKLSKGLIDFLPLRMYENYILHPEAIANVINKFDENRPRDLSSEDVENRIQEEYDQLMGNILLADEPISQFKAVELIKPHKKEQIENKEDWLKKVNAGNLLSKIFSRLSDARVEFSKTTHSVAITRRILELHSSDMLKPIADLLLTKIDKTENSF